MDGKKKKGNHMKKVVEIAHEMIRRANIGPGCAADFTLGQGFDCELLMSMDQIQHVFAFDVQKEAIVSARTYLQDKKGYDKVEFIMDGHEHCDRYIHQPLQIAVFNFGYFPKGDHQITTQLETSITAVKQAMKLLDVHGLLVLVLYPGHAEGRRESDYFDSWIAALPSRLYDCASIHMCNKKDCPYLLVIERKRKDPAEDNGFV